MNEEKTDEGAEKDEFGVELTAAPVKQPMPGSFRVENERLLSFLEKQFSDRNDTNGYFFNVWRRKEGKLAFQLACELNDDEEGTIMGYMLNEEFGFSWFINEMDLEKTLAAKKSKEEPLKKLFRHCCLVDEGFKLIGPLTRHVCRCPGGPWLEIYLETQKSKSREENRNAKVSLLREACRSGRADIVSEFIGKGCIDKDDILLETDESGNSLLHYACQFNNAATIEILLGHGLERWQMNQNFETPLHVACLHGCDKVVEILLDRFESVDRPNFRIPEDQWREACLGGNINIFRRLVSAETIKFLLTYEYFDFLSHILRGGNHRIFELSNKETLGLFLDVGAKLGLLRYAVQGGWEITESFKQMYLMGSEHLGLFEVIFRLAVELGKEEFLREIPFLIQESCVIRFGPILLNCACRRNNFKFVRRLVELAASEMSEGQLNDLFSGVDEKFFSACEVACVWDQPEVLKYLCLGAKCPVKFVNKSKQTLLHVCCQFKSLGCLRLLLYMKVAMDEEDEMRNTALHIACYEGFVRGVESLVEADAHCWVFNASLRSPLDIAMENSQWEIVKALDGPKRRNSTELDGKSTLFRSPRKSSKSIDKSWKTPKIDELYGLVADGVIADVEGAIDRGINVSIIRDHNGSLLHWACKPQDIGMLSLLLQAGCDSNIQNQSKQTPLHYLFSGKIRIDEIKEEFVRKLAEDYDFDPGLQDDNGNTVTHLLCMNAGALLKWGDFVVSYLKRFRCRGNVVNKENLAPIHVACGVGILEIVEVLLNDSEAMTADGKYGFPIHAALRCNQREVFQLIARTRGFDINAVSTHEASILEVACRNICEAGMFRRVVELPGWQLSKLQDGRRSQVDFIATGDTINFGKCQLLLSRLTLRERMDHVDTLASVMKNPRFELARISWLRNEEFLRRLFRELYEQCSSQRDNVVMEVATFVMRSEFNSIAFLRQDYGPVSYSAEEKYIILKVILDLACYYGDFTVVARIANGNTDLVVQRFQTATEVTPLHIACRNRQFNTVVQLCLTLAPMLKSGPLQKQLTRRVQWSDAYVGGVSDAGDLSTYSALGLLFHGDSSEKGQSNVISIIESVSNALSVDLMRCSVERMGHRFTLIDQALEKGFLTTLKYLMIAVRPKLDFSHLLRAVVNGHEVTVVDVVNLIISSLSEAEKGKLIRQWPWREKCMSHELLVLLKPVHESCWFDENGNGVLHFPCCKEGILLFVQPSEQALSHKGKPEEIGANAGISWKIHMSMQLFRKDKDHNTVFSSKKLQEREFLHLVTTLTDDYTNLDFNRFYCPTHPLDATNYATPSELMREMLLRKFQLCNHEKLCVLQGSLDKIAGESLCHKFWKLLLDSLVGIHSLASSDAEYLVYRLHLLETISKIPLVLEELEKFKRIIEESKYLALFDDLCSTSLQPDSKAKLALLEHVVATIRELSLPARLIEHWVTHFPAIAERVLKQTTLENYLKSRRQLFMLMAGIFKRNNKGIFFTLAKVSECLRQAAYYAPSESHIFQGHLDAVNQAIVELFRAPGLANEANVRAILYCSSKDLKPNKVTVMSNESFLGICLDNEMKAVFEVFQVATVINKLLWGDFEQNRPFQCDLLDCRECPIAMLLWEGLSKAVCLYLIANVAGQSLNQHWVHSLVLLLWLVTSVFYEIGQLLDYTVMRYINDPWNQFDIVGLGLLAVWAVYYAIGSDNGIIWLCLAAIPFSFSLLRYLIVYKRTGVLVIVIIRMMKDVVLLLFIFVLALVGFGVAFHSLSTRRSSWQTFLTMFQISLGNVDFEGWDVVRSAVTVAFVILTAIMLWNLLIARMSHTYNEISQTVDKEWYFEKAKTAKAYRLVNQRNPFWLLPPPLNIIPLAVYVFWRLFRRSHTTSMKDAHHWADWIQIVTIIGPVIKVCCLAVREWMRFDLNNAGRAPSISGSSILRVLSRKGERIAPAQDNSARNVANGTPVASDNGDYQCDVEAAMKIILSVK